MKFIVKPLDPQKFPITTHCVLCSEDPKWCPPTE